MAETVIASAPPALLDTCLKIVKTFHGVQQWMKPAPLTMTSLANECLGLHEMLTQDRDRMDAVQNNQPQAVKIMEGFLLGCSMTVSVIDEYAMELHEAVTLTMSKITDTALKADIRLLWKEEDMRELLSQTRGYQYRLRGLLDALDKGNTLRPTSEGAIGNQSALINILNRSHSSFQTRPASIRSSLRDSFISLDPSPPYALSLNGDATDAIKRTAEDISLHTPETESMTRISPSNSSLMGENVPKESMASNKTDGLHKYDKLSDLGISKTKLPTALVVATEETEDSDMCGPILAGSSLAHIRDPESGTSLAQNSSNTKPTVASGAQTVVILTPSQSVTQPAEAAPPFAKFDNVILYTIAIAGSEDSGKTELMNWFLHRSVDQEAPSLDNNNRVCKIDDAHVVIDIIDHSGQEYYESMRYNYLHRAEGFLLVYKASSRNSFTAVQRIQSLVSKVTDERVICEFPKQPTLLVAYNVESESERQVSHREGQSLAQESGCTFVSVDGKDYSPVEEAIYDLIRLIRKQYSQCALTRRLPVFDPTVSKMIQAHSAFKRKDRPPARKMFGDIWTRRRG